MAFLKAVTIPAGQPGTGASANYFRIDRIEYIDESARDAKFTIGLYVNSGSAAIPNAGRWHGATVRFTGAAFDLYFAKDAIVAATTNAYASIYQALSDLTAAFKARNALKAYTAAMAATPPPNPAPAQPAALTADQTTLVSGAAQIHSDPTFGGELVFDGAAMA